jgi:hypothetical protein
MPLAGSGAATNGLNSSFRHRTVALAFGGPQLVVFLGRQTHQKGCDTIADAAGFFLAECPQVRLIFVLDACSHSSTAGRPNS